MLFLENKNYKVIDNFLTQEHYIKIKNFLSSKDTPWYFISSDTPEDPTKNPNGFFSFCWYNNYTPDHATYHPLIVPILLDLNCYAPVQVRANLVLRDKDTVESGWHTDFNHLEYGKTAIMYFTTCNAKTLLKIEKEIVEVESVENRIVLFKSSVEHKVKYQTDTYKRIVINFNYI